MNRFAPRAAPALLLLGALAGCQDYNFNPVGHCLIHPGNERVPLANISGADVLFVVDDSGSMAGKQAKLAAAFDAFINDLNNYNQTRVGNGLEPFDFHLAITTTSVFYNPPTSPFSTCQAACGTASNVCCQGSTPLLVNGATVPCTSAEVGAPCGQLRETYGFLHNSKPCGAPALGTVNASNSGGQLAAGTYYVKLTAMAPDPNDATKLVELAPQAESAALTITGTTGSIAVNWSAVSAATAYKVYLGTLAGAENVFFVVPTTATAFTITTAAGTPGYPPTPCAATSTCPATCGALKSVCCTTASNTFENALDCRPGIATDGAPYPQGDFVGLGSNPRVLHFDKQLYGTQVNGTWTPVAIPATATNAQGLTRQQLIDFFKANVNVGSCGSGQEQGLQAGRLAMEKALAGTQREAGGALAAWPHPGTKLVVVYIGDEDDCSSPNDIVGGVVLMGKAGVDTCVLDTYHQEYPVTDFVSSLEGLNRPLGAAFIVSTAQQTCVDLACGAGICCDNACTGSATTCNSGTCGGQAGGTRFFQAANALGAAGADIVAGSICDPGDAADPGFAGILTRIAEIAKPPSALTLPTQPADAAVTLLRIVRSDGTTRKICHGPALGLTYQQAHDQGYDWWFTVDDKSTDPAAASRFVYINHDTRNCEANPGESYSADYLGIVPEGGCSSDRSCAEALGGIINPDGTTPDWTCFAGVDAAGKCNAPQTTTTGGTGTCVCGGRAATCPAGSL